MLAIEEQPVAELTRVCTGCALEKPLSEFRLRKKGGTARHPHCRACYTREQNAFYARRRTQNLREFTTKAAAERDWRRVVALVSGIAARLRGTGNVVTLLLEEIEQLPSSSRHRLNALTAIANLHAAAEQQRMNPSVRGALSRAEVLEYWDGELRRFVAANPTVIFQTAAALGWKVEEPAR